MHRRLPGLQLGIDAVFLIDLDREFLAARQQIIVGEGVDMRDLPPDASQRDARWIVSGHEHGAFGIDPADIFS